MFLNLVIFLLEECIQKRLYNFVLLGHNYLFNSKQCEQSIYYLQFAFWKQRGTLCTKQPVHFATGALFYHKPINVWGRVPHKFKNIQMQTTILSALERSSSQQPVNAN